jgi:prepilin peptidase CpaA
MTFETTAEQGLWFLIPCLPICIWVAYTDLSAMRIPNKAVIALFAVFVVVGYLVLPSLGEYAWRFAHLGVVLVIGFMLTAFLGVGAGDSKFAAAMAPFVALGDVAEVVTIFCVLVFITFALHRLSRSVAFIRKLAPSWESWTAKKFPMGITLTSTLAVYLGLAAAQ